MNLAADQLAAARARGCVLLPATEAQVQRLSMQRRVFCIDGEPFVATRDGGVVFETHGTLLLLLIEGQAPGRERGIGQTAQEAAAADAAASAEIATEQRVGGGGAQVVRRPTAARPRTVSHGGKRGV